MNDEILLTALIGMRAMLDALIMQIQGTQPAPQCPHADTENIGTFGAPKLKCRACGAIVK